MKLGTNDVRIQKYLINTALNFNENFSEMILVNLDYNYRQPKNDIIGRIKPLKNIKGYPQVTAKASLCIFGNAVWRVVNGNK